MNPKFTRVAGKIFRKAGFGFAAIMALLISTIATAQTTHLSPTVNNGGFESGTTGWTLNNGTQPNKWVVSTGADAGFSGTQSAYISQTASAPFAHTYNTSASAVVQLYRDVTFPAGETAITLSFKMKVQGEAGWDWLRVFVAPTTITPTAGTLFSTAYQVGPTYTMLGGWTTYNIIIPQALVGNSTTAQTRRIMFEWRNDGIIGTQPPAGIDDITLISACGGPSATSATAVTMNSATLNWNAFPGATGYSVRWKKTTDPVTVPTWSTPTIVGNVTSLNITGLSPNQTVYQYEVAAIGASCAAYGTGANFSTLCGAVTPPWTETFESITANNQLPSCMTATNLGNVTRTYIAPTGSFNQTNHTPGGSKYASFRYYCNDWFFSPQLQLQAGTNYLVSFWYITDGYANSWQVLKAALGTAPNAASMTTNIGTPLNMPTNTTYQQYTGVFTAPANGIFYVGFNCQDNGVPWYLSIDDLSVVPLPPCSGTPTAGVTSPTGNNTGCPGTSYTIQSSGTSVAGNLAYQWLQSTNAAPAWVPVTGGSGATTNTYVTPPLTDTIRYRMKVTCTNSNQSDTTAPVTFNVPKLAYASLPFTENFELWTSRCGTNDIPSPFWSNVPFTGNASWRRNDQGASAAWTTPTGGQYSPTAAVGSYSARYHAYFAPTNNNGQFNLLLDCSTHPGIKELSFYLRTDQGITYPQDSMRIFLSQDGGANFIQIGGYGPGTGGWDYKSMNFASNSAQTVISFRAKANYQYYTDMGLDYVRVLPPCVGQPTAGTVTPVTPCPNQVFSLTLTGSTQAAGMAYQWQKSTNGTTWTNVPNSNTPFISQSIATPSFYRAILTCIASNQSDTTPAYQVNFAPFYFCYCNSNSNPAYQTFNYANVGNVKVARQPNNALILDNGTVGALTYNPLANANYSNFTGSVLPPTLYRDSLYRFTVTQHSQTAYYASPVGIWIDLNRNGLYESAERMFNKTTVAGTQQATDTFRIPSNAAVGLTGMRVILSYGVASTSINPCGMYNYGETEDYLVNLSYPPCNGPTNPGTLYASVDSICVGYGIDLGDTTYEKLRSGLTRTWQRSVNGGVQWFDMPNSTNKDTLKNVLFTGQVSYRVKMVCATTNDVTYSNVKTIYQKLPYQCYCYSMAIGGPSKDTSDVGAVLIANNVFSVGGPHLLNTQAIYGRTDYTGTGGMEFFADSTYPVEIYHILRPGNHGDAKITMFIDYNNNLVYDIPQERIFTEYTTALDWYRTLSFTIPHLVVPNVPTGLRIILNNNIGPNAPSDNACGAYTSGETEDYVITLRQGTPLGVKDAGHLRDLTVFPNPTSGRVALRLGSSKSMGDVTITVTNLTGQTIHQTSHNAGGKTVFSAELDLGNVARGVYFVEVRTDGSKLVRKVVVQ